MEKTIKIFETINNECYSYTAYYTYNQSVDISIEYKDGRVDASKWITKLACYFISIQEEFLDKFKIYLQKQKDKISLVKHDDYSRGLYDQIVDIENTIELYLMVLNNK